MTAADTKPKSEADWSHGLETIELPPVPTQLLTHCAKFRQASADHKRFDATRS